MNRYLILASAFLFSACAGTKLPSNVPPTERKDPVAVEAKFAGSAVGAQYVVEARFAKGKAHVSAKTRKDIRNAIAKAKAVGPIDTIRLVAWSDQNSAGLKNDSLPKADQDLADLRLDALEKAIGEKMADYKVEKHNMAASPSALDRFFSLADYKLKSALADAGVSEENQKGTVSMASKGLLMISNAADRAK